MNYHSITQIILDLLKANNFWFETFEHEAVRTSEEAAKTRPGYTLHQGAKAIIVRVKLSGEKKFMMLVIPADNRFDTHKVKQVLQAKDVRFATEGEVKEITKGVEPGGVPPFGNLFGLEVLVDPTLFQNEKIVFNAGDRKFSVAMRSADFKVLVQPRTEHII